MPKSIYTEIELPELVRNAVALANQIDFPLMPEGRPVGYHGPPSASIPQVGRLLQALAAGKPGGWIGELGAGAGVGTAWLASGLAAGAHLISVELNRALAGAVGQLFADYPNVEIRAGDWHQVMPRSEPYDLLFMDATPRADLEPSNWDSITELITIGGQIVMDDLTPVALWPAEWANITDYKRDFAFSNPRVVGTEVLTTPTTAALIVTRIR
jgi:predicted O-methyltransferase YrrM